MSLSTNGKITIVQVIITVLLAVSTGVSGYLATNILRNKDRIITIEADRFTAADGRVLWNEFAVIREENRIEDRLERMERYLKGSL
jgi:predicted O-methyltransferase YrrM